ncbi:MAG: hypothetical protein PHG23_01495 [Candidatus Pacebacteria bacterium]|nr:hypothetical protein [Candidatus Paceibacterota bacterium]
MGTEIPKQKLHQSFSNKKEKLGGYFTAGLIWVLGQSFRKNIAGELIVLLIAILFGFFYYPLKSKIKIENELLRTVITLVALCFIAVLLIGFLTTIANNL